MDTDENQAAKARVGEVLRRKWTLDTLIGVGGMAAVYAATHRNGRRGAVKLLHPELAGNMDVRQRFLREARVANTVDHPGAVEVLDDDMTEDGSVFLVMELLEGESFNDLLERSPGQRVDAAFAIRVGVELCEVLAAAHEAGIVHRDLKPENLFLTKGGRLKVLDFGIARIRELAGQSGATTYGNATQTGSVMGTPAFMPPEQALGEWSKVDARSDLWAAGATLYAALSGRLPHEGDTVAKVLLRAMTVPVEPLVSVAPHVPPALAAVIDRALASDREARFPSATAMRDALLSVEAGPPLSLETVALNPLARTTVDATSTAVPPTQSMPSTFAPRQGLPTAAFPSSPLTPTAPPDSFRPHIAIHPTAPHIVQSAPWSRPGTASTLSAASRSEYEPARPNRALAIAVPLMLALAGVVGVAVWLGTRSEEPSTATEPVTEVSAEESPPEPPASEQPDNQKPEEPKPQEPTQEPKQEPKPKETKAAPSASTASRPPVVPKTQPRSPSPQPAPVPVPTPAPPKPVDIFKGMGKSASP